MGEDSAEEALLDLIVAFDTVDHSILSHISTKQYCLVWFGAVHLGTVSSLQACLSTGNHPITWWTG